MFGRFPLLAGTFLCPFIWSVLVWSTLRIVDPPLKEHIDWVWYLLSQCVFGFVVSFVVVRRPKRKTAQTFDFGGKAR